MKEKQDAITEGKQVTLSTGQIQRNPLNPRRLFDEGPMQELKESIKEHGILVPLTVFKPAGSVRYLILDGERRYRCCVELENEGSPGIRVPCNIVQPPDPTANIIYMFAIHKYRKDWELMPTAISLQQLIKQMTEKPSDKELKAITGLSSAHIKRCLVLMEFPPDLQSLSLDENPKTRIPANFWFEMYHVLEIAREHLPAVVAEYGDKFDIARRFTLKYRNKSIKSVIDFRRVKTAFSTNSQDIVDKATERLERGIRDIDVSLTELFEDLSTSARAVANLAEAIQNMQAQLEVLAPDLVIDVEAIRDECEALYKRLGTYIDDLPEIQPVSE